MKKFVYIIISIVIVILGLLAVENKYADERIEFNVEGQNIEYSRSQLYFYNSLHDEYDATADLLSTKTNIVAADSDSKISFKISHKPLRIYELNPSDGSNERLKVSYNKQGKCYYLSPMFDSEECSYSVVADYGFRKAVYSFVVFNKTYINDRYYDIKDTSCIISMNNNSKSSEDVSVIVNDDIFTTDYLNFGFTINNNTQKPIDCSFFKLEKQMKGVWYSVNEKDVSYNQDFWDNYKQQFPVTIQSNSNSEIKFPTTLDALFDVCTGNGISSGIYRVVIPYTSDNNKKIAISEPFTLGYVPAKNE